MLEVARPEPAAPGGAPTRCFEGLELTNASSSVAQRSRCAAFDTPASGTWRASSRRNASLNKVSASRFALRRGTGTVLLAEDEGGILVSAAHFASMADPIQRSR